MTPFGANSILSGANGCQFNFFGANFMFCSITSSYWRQFNYWSRQGLNFAPISFLIAPMAAFVGVRGSQHKSAQMNGFFKFLISLQWGRACRQYPTDLECVFLKYLFNDSSTNVALTNLLVHVCIEFSNFSRWGTSNMEVIY